jgi:hypothetical protein
MVFDQMVKKRGMEWPSRFRRLQMIGRATKPWTDGLPNPSAADDGAADGFVPWD